MAVTGSSTALLSQVPQAARNYINGVNNNNLDSVQILLQPMVL
jgi:hypothetical protein